MRAWSNDGPASNKHASKPHHKGGRHAISGFPRVSRRLKKAGELIEVDRPVSPMLEVAKAMRKSASVSGPAIIFKNNGTAFPLVGGVYNTRAKALIALQTTEKDVFDRILRGMAARIPPVVVTDAPVHENVLTGDAIDLSKIPVAKYSPDDGGPYITAGIVVSKDPETGIPDIGHYRFEVVDKQTFTFLALPNHRFGRNHGEGAPSGAKTFHAALLIGVDPVMAYTCPIQVPDGTNDFEVVGGMRGAALELVRCKTIDVDVPARAELVFELEVDFSQDAYEGPLGEFTGYYTPGSKKPIAHIKAITHRNNAYFQALLTGVPPTENHFLKQMPYEASYFAMLKAQHPTLTNLTMPASGGVAFLCRHVDEAALCRRGTPCDPDHDRQQPASQASRRGRSRYRCSQSGPGRMGHHVPHPTGPRRHHHQRFARRHPRSLTRRSAPARPTGGICDGHRCDISVRSRGTESHRQPGRRGMRSGGRRAWPRVLQSCGHPRLAGL